MEFWNGGVWEWRSSVALLSGVGRPAHNAEAVPSTPILQDSMAPFPS